jgi:hypothetical protein
MRFNYFFPAGNKGVFSALDDAFFLFPADGFT